MKTSQLSKDMSADRRSKLGVCTSPTTAPPSFPLCSMGTLNWQDQKWLGTVWSHSSNTQMRFLKCFKENLTNTIWSDWASLLIFHSFFFSLSWQPGSREKAAWKKEGKKCYRKLIHSTTPLFFSDKTSVAKGQGDLHGEASKEKDTGWKWKDMRSTPLCHSLPSKRSIDFHKKDCTQFLSGKYSQTI